MPEDKSLTNMPHSLIMENRRRLNISGVTDVESFDDQTVVMTTCKGGLTVKGNELNIEKFSTELTEIGITGEIIAIVYTNSKSSEGFFSKIFK